MCMCMCACVSYLQLPRGNFEDKLHHGAHSQTSGAGRVDLVPDGVAVHLGGAERTQRWCDVSAAGHVTPGSNWLLVGFKVEGKRSCCKKHL